MASGVGEATGAISVLNAIPTMIGGAVGIELWSRAHVEIKGDKCSVPEGRSMVWGLEYPIEGKILESISRVVAG
nr:hypothetical protein [Desulfurococcales archaeon]